MHRLTFPTLFRMQEFLLISMRIKLFSVKFMRKSSKIHVFQTRLHATRTYLHLINLATLCCMQVWRVTEPGQGREHAHMHLLSVTDEPKVHARTQSWLVTAHRLYLRATVQVKQPRLSISVTQDWHLKTDTDCARRQPCSEPRWHKRPSKHRLDL